MTLSFPHRRTLCWLLLWSALCGYRCGLTTYAKTPPGTPFRVDHIGVNDGLTQGSVYSMLKDSRNFLWFGTQDGLNRYDGHRFRTYRPMVGAGGTTQSGTIVGVNIVGMVEDPDGNLWVGTEEGLNRYDRRRDRFDCFFALDSNRKPKASRTIPFFVDQTELLYLSDFEGLVRFNYRNQRKTILNPSLHPPKEYDNPSSTMRTRMDDVWLHAPKGLARYNLRDRTLSYYFSDQPGNRFGPAQTIFSFYVDEQDVVWLGTPAGLLRFNHRLNTIQAYDQIASQALSAIYSIAPDRKGRLWLGTQHHGVLSFDKRSGKFVQVNEFTNDARQLSEFEISKVYVDDMGIVWANTDPDGLARIVPNAFLFGGITKRSMLNALPSTPTLSHYTIRAFLEERFDRIWIATENGINILDPRTNRITQQFLTNRKNAPTVRSLYRDPQRRIWVGVIGGVMAYHPETETFDFIPFEAGTSQVADNYVRNFVTLNENLLIAATEDGLYELNIRQRRLAKLPTLSEQNVFSIWYDAASRQLWAGTYLNGYYCYQLSANNTAPWRLVRAGLGGSMVLNMRPDPDRQMLWLATDRGLVGLNPETGELTVYSERQGLANSFVYGSLADQDNNLWISTNRGISRLDLKENVIKNFTLSDGLQGNEFNGNAFLKTATGEMFFGGVNGFNRFRPDQYRSSLFGPQVYIYSFNVNEEPFASDKYVGEADTIELTHNQNTFSMEFAALDYLSNGHNNYQYQLTNHDPQWVSAGERNYVRYANLPPGEYVFQVKAANQDGHWSTQVRKLTILVHPPFWQTLPFIAFMIVLLAVLTYAWIRQRENSIRRQQAERLRLAYNIQEQVKKDIARDLHDEIGTRLATLKLYTTRLVQHINETTDESALSTQRTDVLDASGVQMLKNNIFALINNTISDVRNLLRKLNPQTLERYGYVAAVEELFSRINTMGTVELHLTLADAPGEESLDVDSQGPSVRTRLPADMEVMLYRITQELVNNSLKHANAHRIDLHVQGQSNSLLLTYSDNGQGFDYAQIQQNGTGLGIGSIESRVVLLNGRITWQTQPGQGLRAIIEVPTGWAATRKFFRTRTL
ncbi:histidine kinase [Spirosoma taeanense]|uniref:Histidine kinase n=1 Tax=Spirosoma taeanense TaxID=2735870 RepID=A0A6M5YDD4_9BACT|nr:sensor histidine kinase [Spirosoma taeanense]QJW92027.1 histidine kinase [Spirosoma taeanense]